MYCMDDISHDLIRWEDVEVELIFLMYVVGVCFVVLFVIKIMGLCLALVL